MTASQMDEKAIEAVAKAIEDADDEFGYCMELTQLVDGVSTYTLTYNGDAEPLEFGSTNCGSCARNTVSHVPLRAR